jgi:hypothetical protein
MVSKINQGGESIAKGILGNSGQRAFEQTKKFNNNVENLNIARERSDWVNVCILF